MVCDADAMSVENTATNHPRANLAHLVLIRAPVSELLRRDFTQV